MTTPESSAARGHRKTSLGYWLMGLRFKGLSWRLGRALFFSGSGHQTFIDAWRGRD